MAFKIKQNDTSPSLEATLKDGNGTVIDLTGATVNFHMRQIGKTTVKVDASATVSSPATSGVVEYQWTASDTDTIGVFQGEFEVTYSTGAIETFPNGSYIAIEILDDIT